MPARNERGYAWQESSIQGGEKCCGTRPTREFVPYPGYYRVPKISPGAFQKSAQATRAGGGEETHDKHR